MGAQFEFGTCKHVCWKTHEDTWIVVDTKTVLHEFFEMSGVLMWESNACVNTILYLEKISLFI